MRRLREEHGLSLVPAIAMIAILMTLGGVALQQAVTALHHSSHQYKLKRSIQAADAGIDTAIYALNRADLGGALTIDPLDPGTILQQNCVVSIQGTGDIELEDLPITAPTDSNGRRWCPATEPEAANDGDDPDDSATWRYRASQLARVGTGTCGNDQTISLDREVVAVGMTHDVRRRVKVRLQASLSLLSGAAVQSASTTGDLTMTGSARIVGAAQSNRNITGSAPNMIGGNAIPGPTGSVSGPTVAGSRTPACHTFDLPSIDIGDARDDNDNGSWTSGCHNSLTGLSVSCKPLLTTTGGVTWNASQRTLSVWGNGRMVLSGDTYVLCRLTLSDTAQLVVPNTAATTRVFIDDPGQCSGVGGAGQIVQDAQSRIVNCHLQTQPQSLQLYALGSASTNTTQTFAGGGLLSGTLTATLCGLNIPLVGVPMTIYAPRSHVQIGGSSALAGQVAGDTVAMSGSAAVQPVNALINLNQLGSNPVLPLYKQVEYVECTAKTFDELPAGDPAQGC